MKQEPVLGYMATLQIEDFRLGVIGAITQLHSLPFGLLAGEYRNPFDFLNEFDQWFEFEKRKNFDKEPTHKIIASMLSHDLRRASQSMDTNYTMLKRRAFQRGKEL